MIAVVDPSKYATDGRIPEDPAPVCLTDSGTNICTFLFMPSCSGNSCVLLYSWHGIFFVIIFVLYGLFIFTLPFISYTVLFSFGLFYSLSLFLFTLFLLWVVSLVVSSYRSWRSIMAVASISL